MKEPNGIAVIIPAFKVTAQIVQLINSIGPEVAKIYVVDDCCPDGSGAFVEREVEDPRVKCLYNKVNLGVGGAVIEGLKAARRDGMHIGVKLDGDGQMDPAMIPRFVQPIVERRADYTKGNRFYSPESVATMPTGRLIGNAVLSFVSKFSTGYWKSFDPTNGYIALNLRLIDVIATDKINQRYFFETDLLFRCNLVRARVLDVPMTALYADEKSNLKFEREVFRFMAGHLRNFFKRIVYSYFLRDFSVASVELLVGLMSVTFGIVYGVGHLGGESADSAGTVMMAALPVLIGTYLLLNFLNYDVQMTPSEPISDALPDAGVLDFLSGDLRAIQSQSADDKQPTKVSM